MVIAAKCVPVVSSWVSLFILTCNNELAVQFHNGVCCLYPGTNLALFQTAISWPSPGKFVHRFLYKRLPYRLIKPPCPAQACSGTITTTCCPTITLPNTLHGTLTGAGALNGTYAMYYTALSVPTWKTNDFLNCSGLMASISITCQTTSSWSAVIGVGSFGPNVGSSCIPFSQVFSNVDLTDCGGPTGATLTVTL